MIKDFLLGLLFVLTISCISLAIWKSEHSEAAKWLFESVVTGTLTVFIMYLTEL